MPRGTIYKYTEYHKIINGVEYKKCTLHNEWFPDEDPWMPCNIEYFYKNEKNKADGLCPECRRCSSKKARKRNLEHPEEWKVSLQKTELKPERKLSNRKRSEKQRKAGKQKKWQQNNSIKVKESCNKKIKERTHYINNNQWKACKDYFNNECAYCGLHIDKHYNMYGGKLRKEDLNKEHVNHFGSNGLDNCVPACKSCNSQKWEFPFEEWYNKSNINFTNHRYNKIIQWLTVDYKQYVNTEKPKKGRKKKVCSK